MHSKRKTFSPMVWFALRYAFWAPFLFGLIYFESFSPFIIINELQTNLSILLMHEWISFHTIPVNMIGPNLIFDHGLKLTIVHECNGMAAFLLFVAAILSYPAPGKIKSHWIIIGYLIIFFANTVRLVGITYHVIDYPEDFIFLHEVIGRYIIAMIPLVLFYYFSNHSPRRKPVGLFQDR